MILQALKEYYERVASNPDVAIAPEGFEKKELPFLIVISENGEFITIEDTREIVGKRKIGKSFILPRSVKRAGSRAYATTFLLWDHIGYLLGQPAKDSKSPKQHQAWVDMLENLPSPIADDAGVRAIKRFYSSGGVQKAISFEGFEECLKTKSCNLSFRLESDLLPIPCREAVKEHVEKSLSQNADNEMGSKIGVCIITGEKGEIARTHAITPISKDTKSLVGIQKKCGYDSYGKEQGYNAPIILSTEFAYVTALNTLLKSRKQRVNVGDAATIFWSKKKTAFEKNFSAIFSEPSKDDPNAETRSVKSLLNSFNDGVYVAQDSNTEFYILGLSPNSARISVRFWHADRIEKFAGRIKQHFDDLAIVKSPREPEYYSLWRLLVNIAVQGKTDNIPPNMAGELVRSIMTGNLYPATLLQGVLRRIRSDPDDRVTAPRASIIKAYLNRYQRIHHNSQNKEITMGLDINQPSVGYQLGRLFATLAKIQSEAQPGINATIKDRFYGAACSSPVTVFANLMRLKNHHLAKLENKGRVVNFERLLAEILSHLSEFPAHLDMYEQGRFAIGYYHQWQDFFTKTKVDTKGEINMEETNDN